MNNDENCNRAFEIVGVYFANCFWNRQYKIAFDAVKDGKYLDMHEAYKVVIERYNRAFGRQERHDEKINPQYTEIMDDIRTYYETQINKIRELEDKKVIIRLSYRDFIDTFANYLLPKDEYESMLKYDVRKEKNVRMIFTQTVAKFTMYIIRDGSSDVIDNQIRSNPESSRRYLRIWSNKFSEILDKERNDLCNLILASRSGIDVTKENMDSVPKLVVDKMQSELRELMEEKGALEVTVNKYVDYIEALKKLLSKSQRKNEKLERALRKTIATTGASTNVPVVTPPVPPFERPQERKAPSISPM